MRFFTILSFLLLMTACSNKIDPEAQAIREVFQLFQQSLQDEDGDLFISVIDNNTKAFYAHSLKMIREYDSLALVDHLAQSNYPIIEKLFVFSARTAFPAEVLRTISPEEFVRNFVSLNAIGGGFADKTKLRRVDHIEGSGAYATMAIKVARNLNITSRIEFVKINGEWKVDVTSRLMSQNRFFIMYCRENGWNYRNNDCINAVLKEAQDYELDEQKIWEPVGTNAAEI